MPANGYCSFTQSEACFQRGQEAKPFTIAIEMSAITLALSSFILPIARKGLASEPNGIVVNAGSGVPKAWARIRFKNFSTSNLAAFYTSFTANNLPLNQKNILVLTYCGNKMLGAACFGYYENGISRAFITEGTITEAHEFENETSVLTIGGSNGHPQAIARMTMWKRALSASEVALGMGLFDLYESDKIVDTIASMGNGAILYNLLNSNHGTLTNTTLSSVWGTPSDVLNPHNEIRGFSLYQNDSDPDIYIRVPYKNDGTPNISSLSGYTKISENPAGAWFNDSESKFKFEDELVGSDLMNSDIDNVFFDVDGTAKWFDLNSVYSSNRGYWYLNILDPKLKKQFTVYKTDKVNQQDVRVLKWHKMGTLIERDENGAIVFDEDGHANLEE